MRSSLRRVELVPTFPDPPEGPFPTMQRPRRQRPFDEGRPNLTRQAFVTGKVCHCGVFGSVGNDAMNPQTPYREDVGEGVWRGPLWVHRIVEKGER